MKKGLSLITAFLVLASAFCVSGTVMSKERNDYTQENERYALLEDTFRERTKGILEERGYRDSGVTITWTRENGGARSYRVLVTSLPGVTVLAPFLALVFLQISGVISCM